MVDAWWSGTVVAVVGGVVGFFVVLRSSAFVAHAVPQGAFAGAAGASLVGVDPLVGLAAASLLGGLGIGWLGRRGRHDAVTALVLVVMLGVGALFLSWGRDYESQISSLLFGDLLGVSPGELAPEAGLGAVCLAAVALLYRPLLLSSVLPGTAEAHGLRPQRVEMAFLVTVALVTTVAVPVVGALLVFSLLVGPPAAAAVLADRPGRAIAASVAIALVTVWLSVAAAYWSSWPVGFFVGTLSAAAYALARVRRTARLRTERLRPARPSRLRAGVGSSRI